MINKTDPPFSEEDIYQVVKNVVLSAELPPGTHLPETRIARLFGVSRERLRKVFHRLGHEHTLEVQPNVGTVIPTPSLLHARELFEARRILESGISMQLCQRITADELEQLRQHLELEKQVAESLERPDFILTSSQFHLLLAGLLGNQMVVQQLEYLLSKSALFSTFHDPKNVSFCSCYEHEQIFLALEKRDMMATYHATVAHLSLVETRLQPVRRETREVSLEDVFRRHIRSFRAVAAM